VNAHEGKAGMVLFAGKTVRSMPERFVCTLVQKALYEYSSFPFLSYRPNRPRTATFMRTLVYTV